ncbi:MAG: DUF3108 domain-containing protein [Pseudomonadota bacterium]
MNAWQTLMLLLVCSSAQAAAAELRPFIASYSITAGSAEVQLKRLDDERWSYEVRVKAFFLARPWMPAELTSSLFAIQDGRVIPHQFTAEDRSSDKVESLVFDWNRGRVTGIFERKPVDLPTQPGLLDSQTAQVALMNELLAGRTPQHFVLVEKGKIKEYTYTMEGSTTLRTAVGEHRTVIYRSTRAGSDKSTVFWCAPDLGYLPLKVERREGRNVNWSMTVKTLDIDNPAR